MVMGALRENKCYASVGDAVDAYFLGVPPSIQSGSPSQVTRFEKVGDVWFLKGYEVGQGGWVPTYSAEVLIPSFPDCNPLEGYQDGTMVGWLIASALIGAGALMSLRRGAR